jgi:trimeric autotransporter adhesin
MFDQPFAQDAVGGPIGTDQNQGVTNYSIANGRLTATLNGGQPLDLPISPGFFPVTGTTTTPVGSVFGSGYYDPTTQFFTYDLFAIGSSNQVNLNHVVVVGGTPTPNGGLLPGGAQTTFETWNLTPDLLSLGIPTLPAEFSAQFPAATVAPMMAVFQDGGTIGVADPNGAVRSHYLWAAFDVEGQGSNQKSMLIGSAGGFYSEDGAHLNLDQSVRGSLRPSANGQVYRVDGGLGTVPDATGNQFFGPNLNDFVIQNNEAKGPNLAAGYTPDDVSIQSQDTQFTSTTGYTALATQTATPASIGTLRSSRTMNGYFAALGQSFLPGTGLLTPYAVTNADGLPTDLTLQTDTATNTIAAFFKFTNVTPADQSTDVTNGAIGFGGIGYGRSAYVDDQHMAALQAADPALVGNVNGNVGIGGVDQIDGSRSFFVSHDVVGTSGLTLPAGSTFCSCQYLQWGYWNSNFRWNDTDGPNQGRNESFYIGTWVAGDLSSVADLEGLVGMGTATFNGHVIADVFDGANQYLAAGAFQDVWNFAARNGSVTITGLDGHNYASAPGGIIGNGANFAGSFQATDNSRIAGNLNGSFFNAPKMPAAYQGGSLFATGPANYRLSGTFAGQRY